MVTSLLIAIVGSAVGLGFFFLGAPGHFPELYAITVMVPMIFGAWILESHDDVRPEE